MQEQDEPRTVGRRKLLRRAGTVAAGAAGATVAGALAANPAQAAPGDSVVIGQANSGDSATTTLTAGSAANPALRLANEAGPALSIRPTETFPSLSAPAGSVYIDTYGDFNAIGDVGTGKFLTTAYSPTWATMTVPLTPIRWIDTRNAAGRTHVKPGSATFDSDGRVLPKNSTTTPDMIIDLSAIFAGGHGAVQANLTVLRPTAQGYASLWDEGNWPVSSSINYAPALVEIANFTQTLIGGDQTIRLKTQRSAQFILDIVGFVMVDPFWQFADGARTAINARGGNGNALGRWEKRAPRGN